MEIFAKLFQNNLILYATTALQRNDRGESVPDFKNIRTNEYED